MGYIDEFTTHIHFTSPPKKSFSSNNTSFNHRLLLALTNLVIHVDLERVQSFMKALENIIVMATKKAIT
jgi:hypothetical protein